VIADCGLRISIVFEFRHAQSDIRNGKGG